MMSGTDELEILLDERMNKPRLLRLETGDVAMFSARCPNHDGPNEDSAAVIDLEGAGVVLVVADGMGGASAGDKASAIAVQCMLQAFRTGIDVRDASQRRYAVLNGFERANEAVLALGVGAGTTLAAVEIADQHVRPYHAGDSLVLLAGARGKVKLQTMAHSPVGYGVAAGLLEEDDAIHHEDRHVVSNILGASKMRIEIGSPIKLAARDTLVVASDGLSDNVFLNEIVELIRKGKLDASAGQLAALATSRMGSRNDELPSKPDDLTFLAFRQRSS